MQKCYIIRMHAYSMLLCSLKIVFQVYTLLLRFMKEQKDLRSSLHVQMKLPSVSVQLALGLHVCISSSHSLISAG